MQGKENHIKFNENTKTLETGDNKFIRLEEEALTSVLGYLDKIPEEVSRISLSLDCSVSRELYNYEDTDEKNYHLSKIKGIFDKLKDLNISLELNIRIYRLDSDSDPVAATPALKFIAGELIKDLPCLTKFVIFGYGMYGDTYKILQGSLLDVTKNHLIELGLYDWSYINPSVREQKYLEVNKGLFKGVFRLVLERSIGIDKLNDLHQFLMEHPNIIWVDKLKDSFRHKFSENTLDLLKKRQLKIKALADDWVKSSEIAVEEHGLANYLLYADAIKYYLRKISKNYEVERNYDAQIKTLFVQKVNGPFNTLPPEILGIIGLGNSELLKIYASLHMLDKTFEEWRRQGKTTETTEEEVVHSSDLSAATISAVATQPKAPNEEEVLQPSDDTELVKTVVTQSKEQKKEVPGEKNTGLEDSANPKAPMPDLLLYGSLSVLLLASIAGASIGLTSLMNRNMGLVQHNAAKIAFESTVLKSALFITPLAIAGIVASLSREFSNKEESSEESRGK
ncbi:MAG: hypothetical protein LW825_05365 [Candidatus Jidaibacter sp.]|nr:hypothetical protein [Candidatus Jidaibacter sp.]